MATDQNIYPLLSFTNQVYQLILYLNNTMRTESDTDRSTIAALTEALHSYMSDQQRRYTGDAPFVCVKIMKAFTIIFNAYFCQIIYYKASEGVYKKAEDAPNRKIYSVVDFVWSSMKDTYEEIFKDRLDSTFIGLCKEVNVRRGLTI